MTGAAASPAGAAPQPAAAAPRATLRWLFAIGALLLLLSAVEAVRKPPTVMGDGREYQACVYNLARGHGLDIVELPADLQGYLGERITKLNQGEGAPLGTGRRWGELIRDPAGRIVTWHWCGYAAFLLPAHLALDALGADLRHAFAITNFGFVAVLLGYLAWGSRQSPLFRASLGCLFLLGGTSFYIWWSHPEVMSAALAALGLVAWLDRRPLLATLSLALAGTQNPPIALLIAFPWAQAAWTLLQDWRARGPLRPPVLRLAAVSLAALCVLIPSAWYLHRLGVSNPIMAAGAAHFRSENFLKSLDLFFDLNLGLVLVGLFNMLFLAGWGLWMALRWRQASAAQRLAAWRALALLAAAYAMAVLAAAAINWNPGLTVISRYAYWTGSAVLVATCLALDALTEPRQGARMALALALGGALLVACWGVHGKRVSYERLTRPAKWALQALPTLYFPHPEIFCERAQGHEVCLPDRAYVYATPDGTTVRFAATREWVLQRCGGRLPLETPTRTETYLGYPLLWYSGPVTCPSGLRLDNTPPR